MSSLPPKLAEFLEDLSFFPDRADRIQVLISTSDRFQDVPPEIAERPFDESHRVSGCESEAFVWCRKTDGKCEFFFAVENPQGLSAKAMAVILKEGLDGSTPEEVATIQEDLPNQIFGAELSMGKSMGLSGMVRLVKQLAQQPPA